MPLGATTYEWYLLVHLLAAIVWVGGGIMLQVLARQVYRQAGAHDALRLLRHGDTMGTLLFAPSSLLLLVFGFLLVYEGDWGYPAWVVIGLAIFGLSLLIGAGFYGPQSRRIDRTVDAHGAGSPEVDREVRLFLAVARVDVVLLVAAVIDMTIKAV